MLTPTFLGYCLNANFPFSVSLLSVSSWRKVWEKSLYWSMFIVTIWYYLLVITPLSCAVNPAISDSYLSTENALSRVDRPFLWFVDLFSSPWSSCGLDLCACWSKEFFGFCKFSWYSPLFGPYWYFLKWQMVKSHMPISADVCLISFWHLLLVQCKNQCPSGNQMVRRVDSPLFLEWSWCWLFV